MLFDYAKASDCSVTLALTDNLCEVAKIWAMKDRDSSDEEFVSLVENRWTNSIMEMITNMQFHTEEIRRTRLKNLLAEFNLTHDYQFCFNNESIKTSLQLYNDAQGAKKDLMTTRASIVAMKQLARTTDIKMTRCSSSNLALPVIMLSAIK